MAVSTGNLPSGVSVALNLRNEANGCWYVDSSTGNIEPQTGTSGAVDVKDRSIHPGENSTFDRTYGGRMPSSKAAITVSGAVGSAGARMYHGYMVTAAIATSPVTVYDNTAGSGTVIDVIPVGTAAGAFRECAIPCSAGIYASFGGTGTVLFLYS